MVRLMTIPAKNAAAMLKPLRRTCVSDAPATPAIPSPTGKVQGQTALAITPATIAMTTAQTEPGGKPAAEFWRNSSSITSRR